MKSFLKIATVLAIVLSIGSCTDNKTEELIEESISIEESINNLKSFRFLSVDPDNDGTEEQDDEEK